MGWIPVTDQGAKIPIIGLRYKDGMLAVRWADLRLIFEGVPEDVYRKLQGHAMASVYYRAQIKGRYPCVDEKRYVVIPAYQPVEDGPARKRDALARQRQAEMDRLKPISYDLFGKPVGSPSRSTSAG